MRPLYRAYSYLADGNYAAVEADLWMFVGCFVFGRNLRPNAVSVLEWDLYILQLMDRREDSIWIAYHTVKCAKYHPDRTILVVDKFTLDCLEERTPNMVLMDQPNWHNMLIHTMEII